MKLKYWLAIADGLRAARPVSGSPCTIAMIDTWERCLSRVADALERLQGPNARYQFDRAKWIAYATREPNIRVPAALNPDMIPCTQKTYPGCGCGGYHRRL